MESRRSLARRLGALSTFQDPSVALEQYPTPADIAAHLIHVADLEEDIRGETVVDLGTGTGLFALGCVLRGAAQVIGLDIDPGPLTVARENARDVDADTVSWLRADAREPPLSTGGTATVVMNPPFGAQDGNEGADKAFLDAARDIGSVSYSLHNDRSQEFVEAYAADYGGEITHAFAVELDLERQFAFHETATRSIDAEAYRIEWPVDAR